MKTTRLPKLQCQNISNQIQKKYTHDLVDLRRRKGVLYSEPIPSRSRSKGKQAILIDDLTLREGGGHLTRFGEGGGGGRSLKSPGHSMASDRPPRNRPDAQMSLLILAFVAMWGGASSFPSLQLTVTYGRERHSRFSWPTRHIQPASPLRGFASTRFARKAKTNRSLCFEFA